MTAQEIVDTIYAENSEALPAGEFFTRDEVMELMRGASMRGFTFGSNVSLSMVQGALLVQLSRATSNG